MPNAMPPRLRSATVRLVLAGIVCTLAGLGGAPLARALPAAGDGGRVAPGGWAPHAATPAASPLTSPPPGSWVWPVRGAVLRPFDPPEDPFGPGHRGIDVAAPVGTEVLAPASGVVAFAGSVAGGLFVTIDHGGGLRSTASWVSGLLVREGEVVAAGQPVARSGGGHPGAAVAHVHFGVRLDGTYVDPLDYLGPPSVVGLIHLAPLGETSG